MTPALPLSGIRVLDLSTVIFGPYAAQWLADLGAEVIKVEAPGGDSTRRTGPSKEANMAAVFLGSNRNKQSLGVDLKSAAGREALAALVATADVFMHNMRPQKIKALGFDAATLRARHPGLIYASFHGYGEDGPYAGRPAYDDVIQGQSGIADLFHQRDGQPAYAPTVMADKTCGLVGALSIMAAIVKRQRSGEGSHVEIPMFETMTAFTLVEHLYGHHFNPPMGEPGYTRMAAAWRRPYPTADGHVCMLPYTDQHWQVFFTDSGHPELAADPRFADITARTANIEALYGAAAEIALTRTTQAWIDFGLQHEIPMTRVGTLKGLASDEHLKAVDFFAHVQDAQMGEVMWPGVPVKFDGQRPGVRMAPRLGEHTQAVMHSAGYAADDVQRLLQSGALFAHTTSQT